MSLRTSHSVPHPLRQLPPALCRTKVTSTLTSVVELASERQERKHVWASEWALEIFGFYFSLLVPSETGRGFVPFELNLLEEGAQGEGGSQETLT